MYHTVARNNTGGGAAHDGSVAPLMACTAARGCDADAWPWFTNVDL